MEIDEVANLGGVLEAHFVVFVFCFAQSLSSQNIMSMSYLKSLNPLLLFNANTFIKIQIPLEKNDKVSNSEQDVPLVTSEWFFLFEVLLDKKTSLSTPQLMYTLQNSQLYFPANTNINTIL